MKKKDYLVVAICSIILLGGIYYSYKLLFPSSSNSSKKQTVEKKEFSVDFDTESLEKINKREDYGESKLENIGRVNPFAAL